MKKKYYILIGLITCMFMFLPVSNVKADDNNITLLCTYEKSGNNVYIYYNLDNKKYVIRYTNGHRAEELFFDDKRLKMSPSANISLTKNGVCPKRAFIDYHNTEEVCFDDTNYGESGGHCTKESTSTDDVLIFGEEASFNKDEQLKLKTDFFELALQNMIYTGYSNTFDYLNSFWNSNFDNRQGELTEKGKIICLQSDASSGETLEKYFEVLKEKILDQAQQKLIDPFPPLPANEEKVNEMIEELKGVSNFSTLSQGKQNKLLNYYEKKYGSLYNRETMIKILTSRSEFVTYCNIYIKEKLKNDEISEEKAEELMEGVTESIAINWDELNRDLTDLLSQNSGVYAPNSHCGGIFGDKTFGIIQDLFGIIKMIIPAIVILLGMADFLKVVFSGEEKDMKLAGMRLVKRIIIGIILILLPVLLGFIFDLVGFSQGCLAELL